jgi:hypothetical protein
MFVEVNGAKLYFDVEGAGLVPDDSIMKAKPTLLSGPLGFKPCVRVILSLPARYACSGTMTDRRASWVQ